MVVSAQHEASEAGLRVLEAGGNAIDAAVATGYALAVTDPCCGNIGGGGFMLIHLADGRERFINFREKAPQAATPGMYLGRDGKPVPGASLYGYLAAGVPGTVMGLDRALAAYGSVGRAAAMAPAIALAGDGFVLGSSDAAVLNGGADRLARDPGAAAIFLRPDRHPWQAGDRLVQPDLAATLTAIARQGPDGFYRGPIATALANASRAHGGILIEADLAAYTTTEESPIACTYRGYGIVSAPPPSSGGITLCEMLRVLEGWDLQALGFRSAQSVHLMIEAMRAAYRDRNAFLGDPAFVDNPIERLLSPAHIAELRAAIALDRAGAPPPAAAISREKSETTHYSVADRYGNAVSVTYTINGSFGANVVAPGTGFLLNDEMDDFAVAPGTPNLFGLVQGEADAIRPGKRPLSSMTPTIVEKDGRPILVLGSPGGSRIITAVLEAILNRLDYGMAPREAVDAPRFHYQDRPDRVFYERFAFSPDTLHLLEGMGYSLAERAPWSAVEMIAIGPDGKLYGANDDRRPAGQASGY